MRLVVKLIFVKIEHRCVSPRKICCETKDKDLKSDRRRHLSERLFQFPSVSPRYLLAMDWETQTQLEFWNSFLKPLELLHSTFMFMSLPFESPGLGWGRDGNQLSSRSHLLLLKAEASLPINHSLPWHQLLANCQSATPPTNPLSRRDTQARYSWRIEKSPSLMKTFFKFQCFSSAPFPLTGNYCQIVMTNIFKVVPSVLHQLSENVKKFQWRRNENPTSTLPAGWIGLGWTKQGIRMQFTNFFKRNSNGTCSPVFFFFKFCPIFSFFSIWQTNLKPTKNQYFLNSF